MTSVNGKHLLILIFVTLLVMIFSGSINFNDPQYSNVDLHKYIAMAEASPGFDTNVMKPFVFRIAIPWVAGLLPFSIPTNFYLINIFALIVLSLSFYTFLIEFGVEKNLSLIITIIFQLNKYFFIFLAWNYFQVSDALSLALLFYSFIIIRRKNFTQLLFIMLFSVLIKEYILFIIPAGLFYYYTNSPNRKNLIYFGIISFLSISVFVIIRLLISSEGGESLFIQYTTQVIYYSKPSLLIKRFIIPFTPFGLLPLIFYKDLISFFKIHNEFLIYTITIILLSFFGEPERLMEPLASIYYLFVAVLIKNYLLDGAFKIRNNRSLLYIIIASFMTSFYHLWGRITLPGEAYSIASTIFFTLLVSFIFFRSKRLSERIRKY